MRALTAPFTTNKQERTRNGFTLIETLIAGVLLTLVMTAVGRMSVSALAGSSNLAERRRVEEAIENHIQLVQQADSLLTYDQIPDEHRSGENGTDRACRYPAEYLATALEQEGKLNATNWRGTQASSGIQLFPAFQTPQTKSTPIETTYSFDEDKAIVTIQYSFQAPESNIGKESRSLELSPNFQSYCTPYEASAS